MVAVVVAANRLVEKEDIDVIMVMVVLLVVSVDVDVLFVAFNDVFVRRRRR
jgi:hypothetical protein